MKGVGYYVLGAVAAGLAVWLFRIAMSSNDKFAFVGVGGAVILALLAAGIVGASPAVQASQVPRDRYLREVPGGCLVAVAVWVGLFAVEMHLWAREILPKWLETSFLPGITLVALVMGAGNAIRRARRAAHPKERDAGAGGDTPKPLP